MKTFFHKLFSPIIWGNLLAMVVVGVAIVIGVMVWLADYTHHGEQIEVPDVIGKMPLDARGTLEMRGLRAEIADSSYDSSLPAGMVLSQKPLAGSMVKEGREIQLTINSRTVPTIALPDIAGNCSVREAEERLRNIGFKLDPIEYVEGDAGWVYGMKCNGQDVIGGQQVPKGATIVLLVGGHPTADSTETDAAGEKGGIYDYD